MEWFYYFWCQRKCFKRMNIFVVSLWIYSGKSATVFFFSNYKNYWWWNNFLFVAGLGFAANFFLKLLTGDDRTWFFLSTFSFMTIHTRLQGKGGGISLTTNCHFHPLQRRLDISQVITVELSPLPQAGDRTRTGSPRFP